MSAARVNVACEVKFHMGSLGHRAYPASHAGGAGTRAQKNKVQRNHQRGSRLESRQPVSRSYRGLQKSPGPEREFIFF